MEKWMEWFHAMWSARELNALEKLVASYIFRASGPSGRCRVTSWSIAQATKLPPNSMATAAVSLAQKGWLKLDHFDTDITTPDLHHLEREYRLTFPHQADGGQS